MIARFWYLIFNNLINDNNFFWQGGFDMIASGRDKIETPEQVRVVSLQIYCMINSF